MGLWVMGGCSNLLQLRSISVTEGQYRRLLSCAHLLIISPHHSHHLIIFLCLHIFRCQYGHFGHKITHLDFCQVCFKLANDLLLKFLLGQLHCFQVLFVLFLCLYCLLHGFFYLLRHLFVVVLMLLLRMYRLLRGCFCFLNQHFLIHAQILIGNHQCVVSLMKSDQVIDLFVLSL